MLIQVKTEKVEQKAKQKGKGLKIKRKGKRLKKRNGMAFLMVKGLPKKVNLKV